jgi:hypothetical protein
MVYFEAYERKNTKTSDLRPVKLFENRKTRKNSSKSSILDDE